MNVGTVKGRGFQCREKGCRKMFSLISGTIFEGTHLKLDLWMVAVWQIVNCRNGVSSCELSRTLGIKQQSAWHVLHRVRHVIQQVNSGMLGSNYGPVEADSTFVGGSLSFMSPARRNARMLTSGFDNKAIVHAMKDRKSDTIRAQTIPADSSDYIHPIIFENVAEWAHLYTDKGAAYSLFSHRRYQHRTVNHGAGEYVRGKAHVNGLENFFNTLRRGLKGTYIKATPENLQAYVDEQVFRFNHRKESDWERFDRAMRLIVGKRLTYSELTDGAKR